MDDRDEKVLKAMMPKRGDGYGSAHERGYRKMTALNGAPLCEAALGEVLTRIIQHLAKAGK